MKASELTKVGKVFATTGGWDGKDYAKVGKMYDAYKFNETSPAYSSNKDKTFVKMYSRQFKVYVLMEVKFEQVSNSGAAGMWFFSEVEK